MNADVQVQERPSSIGTLDHQDVIPTSSNSDAGSGLERFHDDAYKKRKRTMKISCEICKIRKVRCDKADPSCGWCTKNNRICIYKERKKPSIQTSYGVGLEDKITSIEASLEYLAQIVENHISADTCNNGSDRSRQHDNQNRVAKMSPIRLSGSQDRDMLHTSSNGEYTAGTAGSRQSHHSDVRLPSLSAITGAVSTYSSEPMPTPRLESQVCDGDLLPRPETLYHLVDMYFKHINTWSPVLDRKTTYDALFNLHEPRTTETTILLHGIVAVTLRFCGPGRLTEEAKQKHREISRQTVQLHALGSPGILALKALALVTVDVLGSSSGPQGWNLVALLARNIVRMGLHMEKSVYLGPSRTNLRYRGAESPDLLQPDSWIEDEGRRRLFWLTYITDRYATVGTSFDFVLDEGETGRALPCRYDLFSRNQPVETRWLKRHGANGQTVDRPENLGSFSYHCEVLQILSQIHSFLRHPVKIDFDMDVRRWQGTYRELDGKLNVWLSHLPGEYGKISQLCHPDPGSRVSNWIMIHAAFVTAVIRLHSVAAYPSTRSHLFTSSHKASQRCLGAVESLIAIAKDVVENNMIDLLGPPFAFSLWTSARLLLVHAATIDATIDSRIWFLISALKTMGQYWDLAKTWGEVLDHLVNEGQLADDDNRAGRGDSSGNTFSEMRRYAHDLSILTARQPRTVIDPPATRVTSSKELDYFEVFEWFNYPKIPSDKMDQRTEIVSLRGSGGGGGDSDYPARPFSVPNPESDWLHNEDRGLFHHSPRTIYESFLGKHH